MAIQTQVTRIKGAKAALKEAIESKGVTVGDGRIETYADKVLEIPQGGGGGYQPQDNLTVEQNGEYNMIHDTDKFYNKVNVQVPQPSGTIPITENNIYDVSSYASADVQIPGPTGTQSITSNGLHNIRNYEYVDVDVPQQGPGLAIQVGPELPQTVPADGNVFILAENNINNLQVATVTNEMFANTERLVNYLRTVSNYDTYYIGFTTNNVTNENTHYYLLCIQYEDSETHQTVTEFSVASFTPSNGYVDEQAYTLNISYPNYTPWDVMNYSCACIYDGEIYIFKVGQEQVNIRLNPSNWASYAVAQCPLYSQPQYANYNLAQPAQDGVNQRLVTFSSISGYMYNPGTPGMWYEYPLDQDSDILDDQTAPKFIRADSLGYSMAHYYFVHGKLYAYEPDTHKITLICNTPDLLPPFLGNVEPETPCAVRLRPTTTAINRLSFEDPDNPYLSTGIIRGSSGLPGELLFQDDDGIYYMQEKVYDDQTHELSTNTLKKLIIRDEGLSIQETSYDTSHSLQSKYNIFLDASGAFDKSITIEAYTNFYTEVASIMFVNNVLQGSQENLYSNDQVYISNNGGWVLWQDWSTLNDPPEISGYSSSSNYNADSQGSEYYVKVIANEKSFGWASMDEVTLSINGSTFNCIGWNSGVEHPWGPSNPQYYFEFYFTGQRTFTTVDTVGDLYIPKNSLVDDTCRVLNDAQTFRLWLKDDTPGPEISSLLPVYDESQTNPFLLTINWNEQIVAGSKWDVSYTPHECWLYKMENGAVTSTNYEMTAGSLSGQQTIYKCPTPIPDWLKTPGQEVALSLQPDVVRDASDSDRRNKLIWPDQTLITAQVQDNTPTYTVTFDSNGGSPTPNSQTVRYGMAVVQPANPTRSQYSFDGWYNGNTLYTFGTPVTSNLTLTAHWTYIATLYTPTDHKDFSVHQFSPNDMRCEISTETRLSGSTHQIHATSARIYINSLAYYGYSINLTLTINGQTIASISKSASDTAAGGYGWSFDLSRSGWINSGANGSQRTITMSWSWSSSNGYSHNGSEDVACSYYA